MALKFDERGLIPAIVQDAVSGTVLMFAWMNEESLHLTRERGEAVFWSRSRNALWHKGATSGNTLAVREIRTDCDGDVLLIHALPAGPACHTGAVSCFFESVAGGGALPAVPPANQLDALAAVIAQRRANPPAGSYVASLFAKGRHKISQKVGEEGLETAMAGVAQNDDRLTDEAADLLFHLLILLNERDIPLRDVLVRLAEREK